MLFCSACTFVRRYSSCSVLTLLLLLIPVAVVRAQGGVGSTRGLPSTSGGIHTIHGQVYFPSGTRPEGRVKIRIESNVSGGNTTSTDDDGNFMFSGLGAGSYTLIVEAGPEYEPARETVTIYGSSGGEGRTSPQSVGVPIQLRLKGAPDPLAKYPKAAREAFAKAMDAVRAGDIALISLLKFGTLDE